MVDFTLSDPVHDAEREAEEAYWTASRGCERAVAARASDAELLCRTVVPLAEGLHASRVLERIGALQMHGVALLFANRPQEALARFDAAIEARRHRTGNDSADLATSIAFAGEAHFCLGRVQEALERYDSAIAIFERAIVALPSMRDIYAPQLDSALKRRAQIKSAVGKIRDVSSTPCLGVQARE